MGMVWGKAAFSAGSQGSFCSLQLYQVELDAGCVHTSIGHATDSAEYIMVVEGQMELEANGETYFLSKDDGFCFNATVPHIYKSDIGAKLVLMIFYP